MSEESKAVIHYTVYVETNKMTEKEATQFPIKLMQAVHHIFPGLKIQVVYEGQEGAYERPRTWDK
jgi:FKBP-type peptidyl-prolyl cis-trans isomerase 2